MGESKMKLIKKSETKKRVVISCPDSTKLPPIVNFYTKQEWVDFLDDKKINKLREKGYIVTE